MIDERKQINYTVVRVNEFARRHNLKIKEAFRQRLLYYGTD